jgi:spore maturation protein CgeB
VTVHQQVKAHPRLRVMFIGLKYDYGDPRRGYSFEHVNFFGTLSRMEDVDVLHFPFDEIMRDRGREKMNEELLAAVHTAKPEICFFFLFTDEIKKETIRAVTNSNTSLTLNWFADDHWRFRGFSQYWAPLFHWVVTTDRQAIEKYRQIGCRNVIRSQWGFNDAVYRHSDESQVYDVTFVGQVHSSRKNFVRALQRSGVRVQCWGRGWPNGRLSQEEMVLLYSRSKINLNFADSSFGFHVKPMMKVVLTRRADDSIRLNRPQEMVAQLSTLFSGKSAQIKGRNFEIPGAGGFLLTQNISGIEEYLVPGREIATFASEKELREKIRYFLSHDAERESIRRAGYERAVRDHTLQKRFEDIFRILVADSPADVAGVSGASR